MKEAKSKVEQTKSPNAVFVTMALDMSWRLALVVLAPILVGVELDKVLKTSPTFVIAGFILAMAGTGIVLWQALQAASRQPVPKLTAAQKRAIKKQNDEDDD
ncbi:MAG TPA: AtpZ/AtpI family protein [Candidatus Saccharimonadia bacterium]|nr:AtpZ/AtpI family protein [Candidatus Saccharimonadia bacterium]